MLVHHNDEEHPYTSDSVQDLRRMLVHLMKPLSLRLMVRIIPELVMKTEVFQ